MACDKLRKSFPASTREQKLETCLGLKTFCSTTLQQPRYPTLPLIVAFKIVTSSQYYAAVGGVFYEPLRGSHPPNVIMPKTRRVRMWDLL